MHYLNNFFTIVALFIYSINQKPIKMKDLKNLCNLLNQSFSGNFVYYKETDTIFSYSSLFTIEITQHKKTNQYVLYLNDISGYVCVRSEVEKTVLFYINIFFITKSY